MPKSIRNIFNFSILLILLSCNKSNKFGPDQEVIQPSEPRFTLLRKEKTGIDFVNRMIEDYENNISNNIDLYIGGGVAVLDINNDGLKDLIFTSSQQENKLYLNEGNFHFKDISTSAGITIPVGIKTGVSIVDINNDGYDDIYICRGGRLPSEIRRNLLYINNKNNTFTESAKKYGLDDMSASIQANFFDFDLDGDLDMYLLNYPTDFSWASKVDPVEKDGKPVPNKKPKTPYDSDRLYQNDGNGHFTDITENAGILNFAFGLSVTVSDFNNDGYPDIYVGNDFISPDILYINNKNGTFTDKMSEYVRHTTKHTMGVDIQDINNDGLLDLFAVDMLAKDNYRQKTLQTAMKQSTVTTLEAYGYYHQYMRNQMQLNNGNGQFSEIGCMSGVFQTDWSWSTSLIDFDNDGFRDLYITNGSRRDVTNMDFIAFTYDSLIKSGGITRARFPDINVFLDQIPEMRLKNYMYRNKGDLTFEDVSTKWLESIPSFSGASTYADLDNDGDMDIIVNNMDDPAYIYQNISNNVDKNNWIQLDLKGPEKNHKGIGAKIKIWSQGQMQYQEMAVVRGFLACVDPILHFGLGKNKVIDSLQVKWLDGKVQTYKNLKVNQRFKINYSDPASGIWNSGLITQTIYKEEKLLPFTHIENEFNDFNNQFLLPHKLSNLGPYLAKGDLNGDGLEDIVIGNSFDQEMGIYLQDSKGNFISHPSKDVISDKLFEDAGITLFDIDGDKDLDMYVVSGGPEGLDSKAWQDRLYFNDGKGNFTKAPIGNIPIETNCGSVAYPIDIDADGDLDLVVGGRVSPGKWPLTPSSTIWINDKGILINGTKKFAPDLEKIGMVTDIKSADLDKDGNEELILCGEFMPITIFKKKNNVWNNVTSEFGMQNTRGWWNCIEVGDYNGDGNIDIAAGNQGMNSRFNCSLEEPITVYADDFDKNGSVDPIFSWYYNGNEYPVVQKDVLLKQIPSLRKKFVKFDTYGKAVITDLYPKKVLDKALVLKAEILGSSVFYNLGNKKFERMQLPAECQFSPVKSIVNFDFNHDGKIDLFAVGNDYGSEVETGRYDAGNGAIMINQGNKKFLTLPNRVTGIWANLEARAAAIIKNKAGKEIVLVANNNGPVQSFVINPKSTDLKYNTSNIAGK